MRAVLRAYNTPDTTPADSMWAGIESELRNRVKRRAIHSRLPSHESRRPWLRIAAVFLLGVALDRAVTLVAARGTRGGDRVGPTVVAANDVKGDPAAEQYRLATRDYLAGTAALVFSLPSELPVKDRTPLLASRASELLLQTRLLIDSPAASDPSLHSLLEDLEVVLAQVSRLRSEHDSLDVHALERTLEQRGVVSRLRVAFADHNAEGP
jgi:hypothetical protein